MDGAGVMERIAKGEATRHQKPETFPAGPGPEMLWQRSIAELMMGYHRKGVLKCV
jgi:hypothetical protein